MPASVLIIDNYDSFTWNLVHAFEVLGAQVAVHRNDVIDVSRALALRPSHVVISPGPGRPEDSGISLDLMAAVLGRLPLLGVCLGHQALALLAGGRIGPARALVHGSASDVRHDGRGLFTGLPSPMAAGRYHSLAVADPGALSPTAWTDDGEIMGLRWAERRAVGVQFHPESILTPLGDQLLARFLLW